MLGILWTTSIFGLISASAVINCLDGDKTCKNARVIAQEQRDVEEVWQKLPRAQEVDFHGNLLDWYHHGSSVQWKKLNLSYNLLTQDVFSNVRHGQLEVVDLTYNRLGTVSIPPSVITFIAERSQLYDITSEPGSRLQTMLLPKNQFSSLKKFKGMSNLQQLDLSCNEIDELNIDHLPVSLRTLKLTRNHIHSISGTNSLPSLEYLDLSYNILTTVLDVHNYFPRVKHLYLQNNKIVMWIDIPKLQQQFFEVNLHNNDWDCKHLKIVLSKMNGVVLQGNPHSDSSCSVSEKNICCTTVDSPYADRLIKYRKQEFKALQVGTAQQETGNFSCNRYEHNPCEGDDNLVYKVAGSAVTNAQSLEESTLKQLEQTLLQEQNIVNKLSENVTSLSHENEKLKTDHADLVAYIGRKLSEIVPKTNESPEQKDAVWKLQELFRHYETENNNLKRQINDEERNNQYKLNEVQILEKEMEELNFQKDRLTEEVNKRNATVNGYKTRINQLNLLLNRDNA